MIIRERGPTAFGVSRKRHGQYINRAYMKLSDTTAFVEKPRPSIRALKFLKGHLLGEY